MGIAGAAFGASQSLEKIMAEQMIQAQMKQREQQAQQQMAMEQQQFAEGLKQRDLQNARQSAADAQEADDRMQTQARVKTQDNALSDMAGVLDMPGMDKAAQQREIIGSSLRTRTQVPQMVSDMLKVEKPVVDPLAEYEGKKKIDLKYREPKTGPQPDYEWVMRGGDPMQIRKGQSRPGDRPYEKSPTSTAGPDPARARETQQRILDTARSLRSDPGMARLSGARIGNPDYALGVTDEPVSGSPAANAKAKFDTLQSVMTLENLGMLKGAMSDKDLLFLKSAGSTLSTKMDDPMFVSTLDGIIAKVEAAMGVASTGSSAPGPSVAARHATSRDSAKPSAADLIKKYGGG